MNPAARFVLKPCIEYGGSGLVARAADKNQSAASAPGKK